MKLIIEINCDNAAFNEDAVEECHRILREQVLANYTFARPLKDINGNTVGYTKFKPARKRAAK